MAFAQDWTLIDYPLHPSVMKTLDRLDFKTATPVQAACIPILSRNKDVAAEAVTGSGKTLAFVIPAVEMLLRRQPPHGKHEVGVLIISPTRELASQIDQVLEHFLQDLPRFTKGLFIGGQHIDQDLDLLHQQGCHIMIGTPGRLEELFQKKTQHVNLRKWIKELDLLIMDEADRILDLGFEVSINSILQYLPKQRRTGLFSATQTDRVVDLIRAGLRNPVRVRIKEKDVNDATDRKIPVGLTISAMVCPADEKFNQLAHFLKTHADMKHVVFVSTCSAVEYFGKALQSLLGKKIEVIFIHGKMKKKRNGIFDKFRLMQRGVLVCTDVMARGVDIPNVHYVLQFDPPSQSSAFVHRCGRTARIGNQGNAIVYLLPEEDAYIYFIKRNQKVGIGVMEPCQGVANYVGKLRKICLKDRSVNSELLPNHLFSDLNHSKSMSGGLKSTISNQFELIYCTECEAAIHLRFSVSDNSRISQLLT